MRYKCLMGIAASLLGVVGGCSSDETPTIATDSVYVAPVADFDPAVDSALWYDGVYDPVTGVFIGQITPGDGGVLDAGILDGGTPARLLPRPLVGLFAAWRVVVRADCIPSVATVDADQDGIPASYTATFNCVNQVVGNQTTTVTGTVSITDADDNSKLGGMTITYTNFTVSTTILALSKSRTINGASTLAATGTGSFQSTHNLTTTFDFADSTGTRAQGTYTNMNLGTYTPDASAGSDVFASGTVALSGGGTLQRTVNGATQSRTITRQTNPNLHWNRSCRTQNADSFGYDSGTLLYKDDQGSSLQFEFNNGCGSPKITKN